MQKSPVHITAIKPGDTVLHHGELRTVCRDDLKSGFMGVTLFGDSYVLGRVPVVRVKIEYKDLK